MISQRIFLAIAGIFFPIFVALMISTWGPGILQPPALRTVCSGLILGAWVGHLVFAAFSSNSFFSRWQQRLLKLHGISLMLLACIQFAMVGEIDGGISAILIYGTLLLAHKNERDVATVAVHR